MLQALGIFLKIGVQGGIMAQPLIHLHHFPELWRVPLQKVDVWVFPQELPLAEIPLEVWVDQTTISCL